MDIDTLDTVLKSLPYKNTPYINVSGENEILLDGYFTLEELEAIVLQFRMYAMFNDN